MSADNRREDGRQSDLAVMDANEYKQKRRLERILDDMDNVPDTAKEAWDQFVSGDIKKDGRNIKIYMAVRDSVEQCHNLLMKHHREMDGKERYWAGKPSNPIGTISIPYGEDKDIVGLRDYYNEGAEFTTAVETTLNVRNKPTRIITEQIQFTMPEQVSRNAYLRLWEFLDDVCGMDISFEAVEVDEHSEPW